MACRAASWAACWGAKAVLLREPLKPTRPALDQPSTLPCMSVIVTCVLLKVAEMLAMPEVMFFEPFALMIFRVAASSASNSAAVGAAGAVAPAAGAASGALAGAGVSAPAVVFLGALAALLSGAALEVAAAPAASGLVSFFTAGFLGLVSSAIKRIRISGCPSSRSDCAGRRRSCAVPCAYGRWFGCADRAPAIRAGDGCRDST